MEIAGMRDEVSPAVQDRDGREFEAGMVTGPKVGAVQDVRAVRTDRT